MTGHLSDIQLIELVSGHTSPQDHLSSQGHISICPQCAAHYSQMQLTWDLLGKWQLKTQPREAHQPPEALADPPARLGQYKTFERFPSSALRMAAAILLAAGVGIALAGILPLGNHEPSQTHEVWVEAAPWQIWHETSPTGVAHAMLSLTSDS